MVVGYCLMLDLWMWGQVLRLCCMADFRLSSMKLTCTWTLWSARVCLCVVVWKLKDKSVVVYWISSRSETAAPRTSSSHSSRWREERVETFGDPHQQPGPAWTSPELEDVRMLAAWGRAAACWELSGDGILFQWSEEIMAERKVVFRSHTRKRKCAPDGELLGFCLIYWTQHSNAA